MLKKTLMHFYELADKARIEHGDSAAKVTDAVIEEAFPDTTEASITEGCDRMFREGVLTAVKRYIRKPPADDRNLSFNDIDPDFLPIAQRLQSTAYFVPDETGGQHISIPELCSNLSALDKARKFMRLKGNETLSEADTMDTLYFAILDKKDR